MVGKTLDYEAKDILNRGIAQGIVQGQLLILFELVRDKVISLKEAAKRVHLSEKEFSEKMNNLFKA